MTNSADWKLVLAPEGASRVCTALNAHSDQARELHTIDAIFADSDCYCAWQFVYEPRFRRRGAPGNPAPGNPAPGNPYLAIQHLAVRVLRSGSWNSDSRLSERAIARSGIVESLARLAARCSSRAPNTSPDPFHRIM